MASEDEVTWLLTTFLKTAPAMNGVDLSATGMQAVLRFLYDQSGLSSPGEISDTLHISSARVAALLNKMESRGLLRRSASALDARVTTVRLTPEGEQTAVRLKDISYQKGARIIDEIGMEALYCFFETAVKIQKILEQ